MRAFVAVVIALLILAGGCAIPEKPPADTGLSLPSEPQSSEPPPELPAEGGESVPSLPSDSSEQTPGLPLI